MTKPKHSATLAFWLMLGLVACGSEDTGNRGIGGSADEGAACESVCDSPCEEDIVGIPSDPEQCFEECEASAIPTDCSVATIRLFSCLDRNDCNGNACRIQRIDFGQCFSVPPD